MVLYSPHRMSSRTASRPAPPTPGHPAARPWNDDWQQVVTSTDAVDALDRWRRHDPRLDQPDLGALLVAAGAGAVTPTDCGDEVLGALVRLAASDRLAARTVLQRVLPGLVAVARRRSRIEDCAVPAVLADLTATAWTAIVTYPVERRPGKYAVNIICDAEYLSFVRPRRLRRVPEQLIGDDALRHLAPPCGLDGRGLGHRNASEILTALLDRAHQAGLASSDVGLLRALYLENRSVEALAAQYSVTGRAIRYRRGTAIARLSQCA